MRKLCSAVGIITMVLLLVILIEAKEQDSYTIAWSDLSTGSYTLAEDKGPVFLGDGAEYRFSVTGAPGNARFKWSVSPSGGIHSVVLGQTTESSSLTWQAPMSGSSYEVKVEAWVPGGEEGGDTLKGRWAESLTIPFLDVYLKDGEDEHHGEAYLPAVGGVQEQVFAFVGVADPKAGLEGIKVWWEDGGSSGSPGAWSPTSGRTVGGCENSTKGEVSTTFTVGESAKAGNHQIIKAVIKTAEEHHVTDTDAPKINIFDVKIEEIWSDQLAFETGAKANYHPGGSGEEDNNYLMIAPVSSIGHLKMKAKLKIEPNVPLPFREKILVRFKDQNGALKGESYLPAASNIVDVWLSAVGWALVSEGNIVVGVDRDGNGILETEDIIDTYEDAKFVLVKPDAYSSSYVWLKGYTTGWPLYPYAALFLNSFLENQPVPLCSYVQSVLIPRNEPSHNVGARFEGSGPQAKAPINNNIFDENNTLSYIITEHDHFRNELIWQVLFVNWEQVRNTFRDDEHIQSKWFVWPWLQERFEYPGGDMYYAFGKVEIDATVKVLVQREGMEVTMVKVEGEQTDLYDWLYTNGPAMDAAGAKVQTGFLTLGDKGRIFKSKVLFDHFLDINYNYMWVWENE